MGEVKSLRSVDGASNLRPFPSGKSGNPSGRPRLTRQQREGMRVARDDSVENVRKLIELRDKGSAADVRFAIRQLCELQFPKWAIEMYEGPVEDIATALEALGDKTPEEAAAALRRLADRVEAG